MVRPKVYLSGPISNGGENSTESQRQYMIEACQIAQKLIEAGYSVLCPQLTVHMEELSGVKNDHEVWMENDLPWVLASDLVVRIPGVSAGADQECSLAADNDIPVYGWVDESWGRGWRPLAFEKPAESDSPTMKAYSLVYGDRQDSYDHPRRDFTRIAGLWSAMFDRDFTPEEVALAMAGVKLSRLCGDPNHEDSAIDTCGYMECLYRLRTGV